LIGNKLENFALRDERGDPWEFKRDFRDVHGRLLLLDFWHSSCQPCLLAIHHLAEFQRIYGPYGLQVVGIAYEPGEIQAQRDRVLGVRGRYHVNYKTLLSGGGYENCPVRKQFQIKQFPTLVLIDDSGKILWRNEGLEDYARMTLEKLIKNKLVATRSSP
jgi:thiol-disulfide isomerase/thioredoxin